MPFHSNPLDLELDYDDEGQPIPDQYVPGSLHWMTYQRLLIEHRVTELQAQAQVNSTAEGDDAAMTALRAAAVGSDLVGALRELHLLETFMAQSGYWDYELEGHDGYYEEAPAGHAWAEDGVQQRLVKVVYCNRCGAVFASDEDVALHQQEGECPVSDQ
jgi:hypothetical protein